jgi:hypothetical protein
VERRILAPGHKNEYGDRDVGTVAFAWELGANFGHLSHPSVQPWHPVPAAELAKIDAEVLQAIDATLRPMGFSGLPRSSDLFTDSVALLTTFAELDHYVGVASAIASAAIRETHALTS